MFIEKIDVFGIVPNANPRSVHCGDTVAGHDRNRCGPATALSGLNDIPPVVDIQLTAIKYADDCGQFVDEVPDYPHQIISISVVSLPIVTSH